LAGLRAELGVAVLLITHDPWVAASASDSVLVLAGGRVVTCGPTAGLLPVGEDPEKLVTRLLVSPITEGVLPA